MKTYKLIIRVNDQDEIEDIKESLEFDERCLEVDDMELTDYMDNDGVSLLKDANVIGIA
jgi:tRNA(His) 5'-end guanylyltransferase|tara:strand:- start:6057 stop:6233 length:177 start_codon:yes stop_codon:yes gene_type:complete